jgi:hypothetical protein
MRIYSVFVSGLIFISLSALGATNTTMIVAGASTIYGAGLLLPPGGGSLPPFMTFPAGPAQTVFFPSVAGQVASGYTFGPDGEGATAFGTAMDSYTGLSGIQADRAFFLAGVFLSDSSAQEPAPPALDFRSAGLGRDFDRLSPFRVYQVQYRSPFTTNTWVNLGSPIQGNGGTNCVSDPVDPTQAQRVYQIVTLP